MNAATRLGLYVAGLAVIFGAAFLTAGAVVPEAAVTDWTEAAKGHDMQGTSEAPVHEVVQGVSSAQSGYLLSPVLAPGKVGEGGPLSFQIRRAGGVVETRFATSHEKALHLIVVRADGAHFRHVHPTMSDDGTWSLPWTWTAAGTYRVYADFVPEASPDAEALTLTRTADVAGDFTPVPTSPVRTATVDSFTVDLTGELVGGASSELTFTVSRDGEPVTTLQPYLGAYGHLVALREGDLAYLHVHPEGEAPVEGALAGPDIRFAADAPTAGRYLLYLDFSVDGTVRTATFVVDADSASAAGSAPAHGHGH